MNTKAATRKQNRLLSAFDTAASASDSQTNNSRFNSADGDASFIRWELVDYIRAEIARDRYETATKMEIAIRRLIASNASGEGDLPGKG